MEKFIYAIIIVLIVVVLAYTCYKITQMPPLLRNRLELIDEDDHSYLYKDTYTGNLFLVKKVDLTKM